MSTPSDPNHPDQPPRPTPGLGQASGSQPQTLSSRSQAPAWECGPGGSGLREGMAGAMRESVPRPEPGNEGDELPPGWIIIKLSEVTSDVTYGFTSKSTEEKIGPHLLRITDIQDNKVNWESVPYCAINDSEKAKYQLKENDLVFARTGATVGKSYLIKGEIPESVFASYLIRVRCLLPENIYYFSHFFKSVGYWAQITDFSSGIGQPNVNGTKLKELLIPFPPLAEQKQIADRLDALLAQVDTLKARLDAIPAILKRFRQSVLAAAVSGKLTEGWRGASELKGWEIIKIEKIISSLVQGWSPKCLNYSANESEWGVVKTSAIQELYFVKSESKKLPDNLEPRPELSVVKNDILITRAGPRSRCGITCIVEREYPKLMICDKVYRVRVDNNIIHPNLLNYQLNSPTLLFDIEKIKTGTSENGMNLTQKKFIDLQIKLPPIKEQTEIVRRVDQLFAFADQIEQRVAEAGKRVDHLTQSILAKAFRGDLTADWRAENPDLTSGDHSAEALLARIRAEQAEAAASPARKTGQRRTRS